MKKVMALLMALVLVLSLVACGGNTNEEKGEDSQTSMSKEELLNNAQPLSIPTIVNQLQGNRARAIDTYKDGIYTIWGRIVRINDDSVELDGLNTVVRVFLPHDELVKLDLGSAIQVVGIITDIQKETEQIFEDTYNINAITLENAHFLNDIYEIKNANVSDIIYSRKTYKYICEIDDDNFGTITINTDKITNKQWNKNNGHNLSVSASGKLINGDEGELTMDDSNFTIAEK